MTCLFAPQTAVSTTSEHHIYAPFSIPPAQVEFVAAKLGTFRCPSQKLAGILRGVGWYERSMEVAAAMDDHTPKMDPARWARIREVVLDAVSLAGPQSVYTAKDLTSVAANYLEWVVFSEGFAPGTPVVWSRELIDAYVMSPSMRLAEGTRRNYRTQLNSISKIVDPEGHAFEYSPLDKKVGYVPYTAEEMDRFRRWAVFQRVEGRKLRGMMMLVCCAGAGCRAREIGLLTHDDIVDTGNGFEIHIGGATPRIVPLLAEWEEWMAEILEVRPRFQTLWGTRKGSQPNNNLLSSFTQYSDGQPPNGGRLRNTWLLRLIELRVPLTDLYYAAGAQKLEQLGNLARHLPPLDPTEYQQILRGEVTR